MIIILQWRALKTMCVVELSYIALDAETFTLGSSSGGDELAELFPTAAMRTRWDADDAAAKANSARSDSSSRRGSSFRSSSSSSGGSSSGGGNDGEEEGRWQRTTDAIAAQLAPVCRTLAPQQKVHICTAQTALAKRIANAFAHRV